MFVWRVSNPDIVCYISLQIGYVFHGFPIFFTAVLYLSQILRNLALECKISEPKGKIYDSWMHDIGRSEVFLLFRPFILGCIKLTS